ncbi:MAG TPA: murein biosynthesis integral membrane protein MurJ [Phototrophicaceae bacterium]|jgi:putative peptidoglycan lipid II flippase|nr:murein biosynthesis integral membrane protein MurJ [Phototrophicaceae bacterium]
MTVNETAAATNPSYDETEDAVPVEAQAQTNEGVARATGILAAGNIASRVLGLAREIVVANLFGAGRATDAFNVALVVPKSLYDLLIAGHVNSAIIPVLSEIVTVKGKDELWRLVSILISIVVVALSVLVLVLEFFSPAVIGLISSAEPQTLELATLLLRLTAPALIFMSLFAVLSGTLYALRVFTWSAFAGAVFNGSIVAVVLLFVLPMRSGGQHPPDSAIQFAAAGWLVGAIAQLILQYPGLRGAKIRISFNWRHPAVRQIAMLYLPVMFSLVLDTLINRFFSYRLAIQSGEGGISYMNLATTLIQFPQGLVATAISIAILPTLARQAAIVLGEVGEQSQLAFKNTLGLGLRLATTLIIPAAVALFVLATPIIHLLFQHGEFTPGDTVSTALALRLYLIGLPFAALDLLLVYAFYARQDTLTPALIGLLSLAVYMVVAVTLQPKYGLFSLMIADSVKHMTHASVSGYLLHRRLKGFNEQRLLLTFAKTGLAALAMGVAVVLAEPIIENAFGLASLSGEVLVVGISGGICLAVFITLALILKIEELQWMASLIRRRLTGKG